MSPTYCLCPIRVPAPFRDRIRELYPTLDHPEHHESYWRMMEYVLFTTFYCEKDPDRIVLPHDVVAGIFVKGGEKVDQSGGVKVDHLGAVFYL